MLQMESIGLKLRQLRETKGLLLRQVAASVDLDTTLLSKIERSERFPTKEQTLNLAKFYNVKESEFLIALFSDRIVEELKKEELALEIMSEAKRKIDLCQSNPKKI